MSAPHRHNWYVLDVGRDYCRVCERVKKAPVASGVASRSQCAPLDPETLPESRPLGGSLPLDLGVMKSALIAGNIVDWRGQRAGGFLDLVASAIVREYNRLARPS